MTRTPTAPAAATATPGHRAAAAPPLAALTAVAAAALTLLAGCANDGDDSRANLRPAGFTDLGATVYGATAPAAGTTATTQDLLTGGLGRAGLGAAAAPAYADPLNPTPLELRRNAIHSNYRAILDPSAAGGYGRLYGPNIDATGADTLGDGLIPGKEVMAVLDDGSGRKQVVVAVQIPTRFDPARPCIVAGPSSGSRGVYGAIGSSAEWGLKKGCAVVLTDAGKGVGLYDAMDDSVNRVDGTRATRAAAADRGSFAPVLTEAQRAAFNAAFPNRLAVKHAHSQLNPERDWGLDTLASIRYAFYALNQEYGAPTADGLGRLVRFDAANTVVIAASVSNGGAAVLRAAEQDEEGLIDGVVASEPNAQPSSSAGWGVAFGANAVAGAGRSLLDYFTFANLYQPCAAQAPAALLSESSVYNYMTLVAMNGRAANRCAALAAKGLLSGATTAEQATQALQKLREHGFTADNDTMHNAHYGLGNAAIISMMYTNAYGRFSVLDNVCGMSAAAVDATGAVVPVAAAAKAQSFAAANGTTNGAPAAVVYNDSVGGARLWSLGVSPSSGTADLSLDAALCQRALATGRDAVTGSALSASSRPTLAQSQAVQQGVREVLLSGNLRGKPTLVVAGRSDALLPVNHNARAYAAFNRAVEGDAGELRYIEVTNAQHFDTFLTLSGFDTRFVPLHPYFNQALDALWARLTTGAALPPSQVVRTTPRGGAPGAAPAITAAQLPRIAATPTAADRIDFGAGNVLRVPQ